MAVLSKVANIAVQPQPVGVIEAFAGSNAPNGWLICDGSQVSRALYPELFSVIGTTYGSGDGFTTFTLPDLRGRTIAGRDGVNNMNNGPTNRLTSTYFGASGTALGNNGGVESNTLSTSQMPSHTHTQDAHIHQMRVNSFAGDRFITLNNAADGVYYNIVDNGGGGGDGSDASRIVYADSRTATNQNTGGGGAHNNTQPTMILNYIIKAVSELPRGGWYNSSSPDLVTSLPSNPYEGQEVYLQQTVAGTIYQTAKRYSGGTWYDTGAVTKPSWIAPALINGWSNYGASYDTAGYLKSPDGLVILKGLLNGGSKTNDISFVLPAGYRPASRKLFPATSGEPWTVSRIDIDSSGNVYPSRTGNTWVGLDGVSFYAEQ